MGLSVVSDIITGIGGLYILLIIFSGIYDLIHGAVNRHAETKKANA